MSVIGQKAEAERNAEGKRAPCLSMKTRRGAIWLVFGVLACCSSVARAGNAPAQLYNKSILISWTESRDTTTVEGEKRHRIVSTDYGLYVSSAGRVFSQFGRTGMGSKGKNGRKGNKVRNSSGASQAPDGSTIKTSNARYHRALSFDGHSINTTTQFESGARRLSVTFDNGFGSCSASVMYGKEAGVPGVVAHGMNGQLHVLNSVGISTPTCSNSRRQYFRGIAGD